jgi:hypothetical protein
MKSYPGAHTPLCISLFSLDMLVSSFLFIKFNWIVNGVKYSLKDQFKQSLHTSIQNSPKTLIYRCFKETFEFEKYLEILDNKDLLDFFKLRSLTAFTIQLELEN